MVKDYRHRLPEEVEKELNEQNPNIKLEISYEQRANTWPGYIAEQSGLEIGEKLDPDKEYTLKITVSQLMSWKIEGVVGKTAEEAIALIKEKTGILPVSDERSYDDLSEEEQKTIKKGVVTDVDPAEGTVYRTTSFEDFSDRLMQQYGIAVKESRGCLSYLPAGRTKFIRAKHLGDKFDKTAVLATLQANAERKPKVQSKQDIIGKLIDIQSRMTEGKGIGYKRWLTKHNLKVMAQTVNLL